MLDGFYVNSATTVVIDDGIVVFDVRKDFQVLLLRTSSEIFIE